MNKIHKFILNELTLNILYVLSNLTELQISLQKLYLIITIIKIQFITTDTLLSNI